MNERDSLRNHILSAYVYFTLNLKFFQQKFLIFCNKLQGKQTFKQSDEANPVGQAVGTIFCLYLYGTYFLAV